MHQEAAGQRNLRGQTCAFAVNRVFNHLHQHGLAFKQHLFDARIGIGVLPLLHHVHNVQEGGALQADVDERALHAGQNAADNAQINIADQAVVAVAFDVQFANIVFFQHGHAGFLRRDVHQHGFRRPGNVGGEGDGDEAHKITLNEIMILFVFGWRGAGLGMCRLLLGLAVMLRNDGVFVFFCYPTITYKTASPNFATMRTFSKGHTQKC